MSGATTFDDPPEFDVGDRVIVTEPSRHRWHRTAAPGERGIVVACTAQRVIAVRLDDGRVEHVHPSTVALRSAAAQQ
jgi:hypothetical protein